MVATNKKRPIKIGSVFVLLSIICMFAMFFFLLTQKVRNSNSNDFIDPVEISKNVEITDSDGNKKIVELPYTINTNKPFTVSFDIPPMGIVSYKTLNIGQLYLDSTVMVGDREISKFNVTKKSLVETSSTYAFLLIDIPYDIDDTRVTIKCNPILKGKEDYIIDPIYVGGHTNFLVYYLFKSEGISLLFTFIIFILSITSLFWIKFSEKNNIQTNSFLKISLISFSVAVYSITRHDVIVYLFNEYRQLLYYFEFNSLMFTTYFLINLIQDTLDPKFDKLILLAKLITFVNFIVQSLLALTYIVDFEKMLIYTYITMFIHIGIALYVIIKTDGEKFEGKKDVLRTVIPCLGIFVVSFVVYYIKKSLFAPVLSYSNIIVFLGGNGYYLISNYMNTKSRNVDTVEYKRMMKIDELTGVYNRYAFDMRIEEIQRNKESVYVTLIDIDNLKPINDNLGHYYGDNVIIRVANYIAQCMSHSNIYRVGGDEFIAITAVEYEEEVKKLEKAVLFVDEVSDKYDVTFSLGKSFYDAKEDLTIDEVIKMSDELMYKNKKKYKDGLRDRYTGDIL
ncbi:diguanylate cyclase (GGDEF) domain protein [Peptostreptococcaceae bacterium AS15]|nr:diguanylate cyclase (GGDEF) domain protein [Peptostreptococcaceae bacterium AS15]